MIPVFIYNCHRRAGPGIAVAHPPIKQKYIFIFVFAGKSALCYGDEEGVCFCLLVLVFGWVGSALMRCMGTLKIIKCSAMTEDFCVIFLGKIHLS